jgi:hypothetical protein
MDVFQAWVSSCVCVCVKRVVFVRVRASREVAAQFGTGTTCSRSKSVRRRIWLCCRVV